MQKRAPPELSIVGRMPRIRSRLVLYSEYLSPVSTLLSKDDGQVSADDDDDATDANDATLASDDNDG